MQSSRTCCCMAVRMSANCRRPARTPWRWPPTRAEHAGPAGTPRARNTAHRGTAAGSRHRVCCTSPTAAIPSSTRRSRARGAQDPIRTLQPQRLYRAGVPAGVRAELCLHVRTRADAEARAELTDRLTAAFGPRATMRRRRRGRDGRRHAVPGWKGSSRRTATFASSARTRSRSWRGDRVRPVSRRRGATRIFECHCAPVSMFKGTSRR